MAKLALFLVVVCFQFFMAEELLAEDKATLDVAEIAERIRQHQEDLKRQNVEKLMRGEDLDEGNDFAFMDDYIKNLLKDNNFNYEPNNRNRRAAEEWAVRRSRRFTSSEPNNRNKRAAEEWAVRRSKRFTSV